MAQILQINGVNYSRLTGANWSDEAASSMGLNGYVPLLRWRRLSVIASILTAAEFNAVYALEGQRVSVTAPPYGDRNAAYQTYYGAVLRSVEGQHNGPNFENVVCEFRVRV